jgi:signal transduction histidine kinase
MVRFEPASSEDDRVRALEAHRILDTLREPAFDDLAQLASELFEVPIALVSLVDRDRQWFKANVGLKLSQTPRDVAFCSHTIRGDTVFTVPDATKDARFRSFPLVVEDNVRFYAGAPLSTRQGLKLGALCVMDRVPRQLSGFQRRALETLARQVEAQLELRLRMLELNAREAQVRADRDRIADVQRTNEELTLLAVHDLKNPLASILPNARFIADEATDLPAARAAAADIAVASEAMLRLVLDLLDLSRAEEGELVPQLAVVDLASTLAELEARMSRRAAREGRRLLVSSPEVARVRGDAALLLRVLENLLDNAFKYSPPGSPVRVEVLALDTTSLTVRVIDEGTGIPPEERERVFAKHARLAPGIESATSRGLGLRLCHLVVEAHGGRVLVEANLPRGTVLRVDLPRG